MKLSINDRTEERLHHMRHAAAISREVFHAFHAGDELFQSFAFVSAGEPPPTHHAGTAYSSFATVVAYEVCKQ